LHISHKYTFLADPKILRKRLPTKVLYLPENLNLWQNPQEKQEVLVMAGLATKKVEAESGLVPKLAGGGSAPESTFYKSDDI